GAACQGQGHETAFAQVAADALGVPLDWVTGVGGGTAGIPLGAGTCGRRGAPCATGRAGDAGSPIQVACERVRDKLAAAAASLLEAGPADVEIADGMGGVRGSPAPRLSL